MIADFRVAMSRLHEWTGIVLGWALFAIVLSGTISVFRPEVSIWMRPEITATHVDPVTATANALFWLENRAPHAPAWFLTVASRRGPFTEVLYFDGKGYAQAALSPTDPMHRIRETEGGNFFYRFHFELQLPYPYGRLITAFCAMGLVLALLTGLVVHRRLFADFFTLRLGKGRRSWLDIHNLTGIVALPFHLIIAFSGAVTLGTLLMPASLITAYHGRSQQFYDQLNPAMQVPPKQGITASMAPVVPLLKDAEKRFGKDGIAEVFVYNPNDAAAAIIVTSGNDHHIGYDTDVLKYSGTTGKLLMRTRETRPIVTLFSAIYGLHIARFADPVTRWLYFCSGGLLAVVIASGLHLWGERLQRHEADWLSTLCIRLNVGVILGLPVSFLSFLAANRCLPIEMNGRSGFEVLTVFCVWGCLLLLSICLPPRTARSILSIIAIGLCLAVIAWSASWQTGVNQGVTLVCLLTALIYTVIFRKSRL